MNLKPLIKIAVVLLCITAAAALLLSLVNSVTADKIEQNKTASMMRMIDELFPDGQSTAVSFAAPDTVEAVYKVEKEGQTAGYAVKVCPNGFGGTIEMIVGIDPAGAIAGVRVISDSETKGIGSKALLSERLDAYSGLSAAYENGVDAVSGATITSRAVEAGIADALSAQIEQ